MRLFNGNGVTCHVIFIFALKIIFRMNKHIVFFIAFISALLISCSGENKNTMLLNGKIDGLREGTIYLQKMKDDSTLVNVDSVIANGVDTFVFETQINEPEIYYLQLDKIDRNPDDDKIRFFAEAGNIEILTTLKKFGVHYRVKGSKNHELLETYEKIIKPINERHLEIIQETFIAERANDTLKLDSLRTDFEKLATSKYLRAVQFALNYREYEIAPYIAAREIGNASEDLLDTINNSLSEDMKASLYGKALQEIITERKAE